jgi:anti-anti-sigma factor
MTELAAPPTRTLVEHECQIVVDHVGPACVVHVNGQLNWATAAQFRDRMRDVHSEPTVIVDLSRTLGMDSAGTGVLLATADQAISRGQQVVVVSVDPVEAQVLRYLDLHLVAPVFGSLTEAWRWLGDHDRLS